MGGSSDSCYFYRGPGWSTKEHYGGMVGGRSYRTVGDTLYSGNFMHYPWTSCFHVDQAAMYFQGMGNPNPLVVVCERPSDPPREEWDHGRMLHGLAVFLSGSDAAHFQQKPSWICQTGRDGTNCMGGPTFDAIMAWKLPNGDPDFARMIAWIHAGGIGAYRRDEIQGYDLYALLYYMAGYSQELARAGQPFLDKLAAFFGADVVNHPTPPPAMLNNIPERSPHLTVYADGGSLKLRSVTRPFPGEPIAFDPALVLRVTLDAGLASELVVGDMTPANNWTLPFPALSKPRIASGRIIQGGAGHTAEASVIGG